MDWPPSKPIGSGSGSQVPMTRSTNRIRTWMRRWEVKVMMELKFNGGRNLVPPNGWDRWYYSSPDFCNIYHLYTTSFIVFFFEIEILLEGESQIVNSVEFWRLSSLLLLLLLVVVVVVVVVVFFCIDLWTSKSLRPGPLKYNRFRSLPNSSARCAVWKRREDPQPEAFVSDESTKVRGLREKNPQPVGHPEIVVIVREPRFNNLTTAWVNETWFQPTNHWNTVDGSEILHPNNHLGWC